MKELLEPMLKQLPAYLPALGSLLAGPKKAILRLVAQANGDLTPPLVFVAVSVAFGFLLQLPQVGKGTDLTALVAGMTVFKVLALLLVASIIHLLFRMVRGHASFIATFSAYLYVVSPMYILLVIAWIAELGILRAHDPALAAAARSDPIRFMDAAQWRAFETSAPDLAFAYKAVGNASALAAFIWLIICWGVFARLHGVGRWRSALVGLVSLAAGSALLYGMQFIALGMFDTRTPALR